MIKIVKHIYKTNLYQNSFFIMLNTVLLSFFGFLFWLIASRLYSVSEIGFATALISATNLISSFSLLGFNTGLIRFLNAFDEKKIFIQTSYSIVFISSLLLSMSFIFILPFYSPKIIFITENSLNILLLISSAVFTALLLISESIFIAYRSSKYIVFYNFIFNILRLILIFIFADLGPIGIYLGVLVSTIISFVVSQIILFSVHNINFFIRIDVEIIKKIFSFSFNNFLANLAGIFPTLVLPLMITNLLSPANAAYYYMPMMIMSFLYIIPIATTKSLLAESSNDESQLYFLFKKATMIIFLLIIPALIIVSFLGQYVLLAFGKEYSTEGIMLLRLLAASSFFASITYLGGTYLNMKKKTGVLVFINILTSTIILICSYNFIKLGLFGIGISWLFGQIVASIIHIIVMINGFKERNRRNN